VTARALIPGQIRYLSLAI